MPGVTVNQNHNGTTAHKVRARLYRGVFSRVARRLRVSRQMVSGVHVGEKTSQRVEKALVREFLRIERNDLEHPTASLVLSAALTLFFSSCLLPFLN